MDTPQWFFTIFSKGNNFHSFLFASLSKRWSTFMRLGSRRSKFFSFVLGVIKDLLIQGYILQGSKQKVTKLVPSM